MAQRTILRNIENFRGLDLRRSDVAGDFLTFSALTNFRRGTGYNSILSRAGSQPIGHGCNFSAIHTYRFPSPTDGSTQEEILGINDYLWRLQTATITITRTGSSGTFTVTNTVEPSTQYKIIFTDGGVAQSLTDQNGNSDTYLRGGMGNDFIGGAVGSYTGCSILDFCQAVDGLSNFSCAIPDITARVNGAQANVNAITVDSGHTVTAGDYIMFWDYGRESLVWRLVTATTSTTITFDADHGVVTVIDNQPLGIGAAPAASIPMETTYSDSSEIDITFYYWEPIYTNHDGSAAYPPFIHSYRRYGYKAGLDSTTTTLTVDDGAGGEHPFKVGDIVHFYDEVAGAHTRRTVTAVTSTAITISGANVTVNDNRYMWHDCRADEGWTPPSFQNWRNVCYIASYDWENRYDATLSAYDQLVAYHYGDYHGRIHKYDGQNVYRAGTPFITIDSLVGGGSGSLTGTFNYFVTTRKIDNRGNIVESYSPTGGAPKTVASVANFTVTWDVIGSAAYGYDWKGAYAAGATTTDNDINVDDGSGGPPTLDVGDKAYFYDSVSGSYVTRNITAVNRVASTYTITVDGAAVTVADNAVISNNYRVCIYRTIANGTVYYLVAELPLQYNGSTQSYTDTTSDATLITKPRYIEPVGGREPDPAPKARFLAAHQGCLVGAGSNEDADIITFSNADAPEEWALASNSFYVPSAQDGGVSAIASDSEDQLAVFKPRAYYAARGDIDSLNFSVATIREGDYGIVSHASLTRVNGVLFGLSHRGVIGIAGGNIIFGSSGENPIGGAVSPAFTTYRIERERAVGFNDPHLGRYVIAVPGSGMFGSTYSYLTYSIAYLFDYSDRPNAGTWFDMSYKWSTGNPYGVGPNLGWATLGEETLHLTAAINSGAAYTPGHLFRELDYAALTASTNANLLYDGVNAIEIVATALLETLGSPSVDKEWHRIKAFFTPNTADGLIVPSSVLWSPDLTITSMTGSGSDTSISNISFDSIVNGRAFDRKLRLAKTPGVVVSLSETSGGKRGALSAIELVVGSDYRAEDVADKP